MLVLHLWWSGRVSNHVWLASGMVAIAVGWLRVVVGIVVVLRGVVVGEGLVLLWVMLRGDTVIYWRVVICVEGVGCLLV